MMRVCFPIARVTAVYKLLCDPTAEKSEYSSVCPPSHYCQLPTQQHSGTVLFGLFHLPPNHSWVSNDKKPQNSSLCLLQCLFYCSVCLGVDCSICNAAQRHSPSCGSIPLLMIFTACSLTSSLVLHHGIPSGLWSLFRSA